jgi:hypothetical protein
MAQNCSYLFLGTEKKEPVRYRQHGETFHLVIRYNELYECRSQLLRGLRHEISSLVRALGSGVPIPLKGMNICVYAFILCLYCSVCR